MFLLLSLGAELLSVFDSTVDFLEKPLQAVVAFPVLRSV